MFDSHPELRDFAVRCVHCGILFLTHPRNAGRIDLRCPFGCRRHHRQQCSNRRSGAYYRTATGKAKKKRLNARRSCSSQTPTCVEDDSRSESIPPAMASEEQVPDDLSIDVELRLEGLLLDESSVAHSPLLPYVRMVMSLIEGREFRCQEVVTLLQKALRQHRMARRRRADYVLAFLHQHPP